MGGGGKGGSSSQVVGYEYFLSWAQVLCKGPVGAVLAVYNGDEQLWCGWGRRTAENEATGIAIETFDGEKIQFFFGSETQEPPQAMIDLHVAEGGNADHLSGYKGTSYAYFDDYKIGNYNRAPSISFVVLKQPYPAGAFDVNLAYTLYRLMTRMCKIPQEDMDVDSFTAAAEQLPESLGGSILYDTYQSGSSYAETIQSHIDAQLIFTAEGKFAIQLLTADTPADDLPEVTDADLVEDAEIGSDTWNDIINVIQVQYPRRYPQCDCEDPPPVLSRVACDLLKAFNARITSVAESGTQLNIDVASYTEDGIDTPMEQYDCVGGKVMFGGVLKTITGATASSITISAAFASDPVAGDQIAVQTVEVADELTGLWHIADGNYPVRIQRSLEGASGSEGAWATVAEVSAADFVLSCAIPDCMTYYYRAIDRCDYDCCHAAGDEVAAETSACASATAGCVADVFAGADPMAWGSNPETIGAGATVNISITGGYPPFTWSLTGTGYSLGATHTLGRTNTLTAPATCSAAYATVSVVDACGDVIASDYEVLWLNGGWSTESTSGCVLSGTAQYMIGAHSTICVAISGRYKQIQNTYEGEQPACGPPDYTVDPYCDAYMADNQAVCLLSLYDHDRVACYWDGSGYGGICETKYGPAYYYIWECP